MFMLTVWFIDIFIFVLCVPFIQYSLNLKRLVVYNFFDNVSMNFELLTKT